MLGRPRPARGTPDGARGGEGDRDLRAREWQQPAQPTQPFRGLGPQPRRLGTLLFDLLTPEEEIDRANVFDIILLGRRLVDVTRWVRAEPVTASLRIGYFGASTGAAAALWAAGEPDRDIAAVVSRGGRPDLAAERLAVVAAPTLLIVGGEDDVVLDLNHRAEDQLRCEHRLEVVPGATHLFEEPGTLEAAANLASDWFTVHMAPVRT